MEFELPEIEIREYNFDSPNFVIFSEDDLEYYIRQLLPDYPYPSEYSKLISHPPDELKSPFKVRYIVAADLLTFNEDDNDDKDSTLEYIESLKNALKAPNYTLQRDAVNALQVPFKPTFTTSTTSTTISSDHDIILNNNFNTKLLESDNTTLTVKDIQVCTFTNVYKVLVLSKDQFKKWLRGIIFDLMLDTYKDTDVYKLLLQNLTVEEQEKIVERRQHLSVNTPQNHAHAHTHTKPKWSWNIGISNKVTFDTVFNTLVQNVNLLDPQLQQKLLEILSNTQLDNSITTPNLERIVHELSSNTITIDEIAQQIQAWLKYCNLTKIKEFSKNLEKLKVDPNPQKERSYFPDIIFSSSVDNLYTDIQEVIKGENTEYYDGDSTALYSEAFNTVAIDSEAQTQGEELDNDALGDSVAFDNEAIGNEGLDSEAIDSEALGEAIDSEALGEDIAFIDIDPEINYEFNRIVNLSGLPCNESIIKQAFLSKKQIVNENVYFALAIAVWWVNLQTIAFDGLLDISNLQLSQEYKYLFSLQGYPLTSQSHTGILPYILSFVGSPEFDKTVDNVLETYFTTEMRTLKDRQNSKVNQIQSNLIEAIQAIKAKKRVNLIGTYISSYIYLPSLLPQKAIPKKQLAWLQGCCLVPLNNNYESDVDWKKSLAALYSIKQQLYKDKFHKGRGVMYVPLKQVENTEKEQGSVTKIPFTVESPDSEPTFTSTLQIPVDPENVAKELVNKAYSRTNASNIIKLFDKFNKDNTSRILNIVSLQLKKPFKELKEFVDSVNDNNNDTFKYIVALAITKDLNEIQKNRCASLLEDWRKVNTVMTVDEITQYINNMREKQKNISLEKLNNMEDIDRENVTELKKLGIINLVSKEELRDTSEEASDEQMDLEGEMEFMPGSTDAD